MERRTFIAALSALTGGGALAAGTGAFSSVEAERDFAVTVADDASSYLGIQPTDEPNGNYADMSGDTLAINLTDDNNNIGNGIHGGEGINPNATTTIADLFEVRNQGTQEVELAVSPLAFGDFEGDFPPGDFPPEIDGVLGALLMPQNEDEIDIEIEFDEDPLWMDPIPEDITFIAIKNISPGDALRFGIEAIALPETAVDSVEIDDEINVYAHEV